MSLEPSPSPPPHLSLLELPPHSGSLSPWHPPPNDHFYSVAGVTDALGILLLQPPQGAELVIWPCLWGLLKSPSPRKRELSACPRNPLSLQYSPCDIIPVCHLLVLGNQVHTGQGWGGGESRAVRPASARTWDNAGERFRHPFRWAQRYTSTGHVCDMQ